MQRVSYGFSYGLSGISRKRVLVGKCNLRSRSERECQEADAEEHGGAARVGNRRRGGRARLRNSRSDRDHIEILLIARRQKLNCKAAIAWKVDRLQGLVKTEKIR
jgi:hypothetical protein